MIFSAQMPDVIIELNGD